MTFASNLATGDSIDFVQILGNVLDIGQPSDDTVKTASLQANSVTGAKLNTDIISAQTALTAEPADTDEFLVSDAGTIKRIDYSLIKGGGITMADQWRISAASTLANGAFVTANWEQVDTDGYGTIGSAMTQSSGVFTFPSTGIYLIIGKMVSYQDAARLYVGHGIYTTTNDSSYTKAADAYNGIYAGYAWSSTTTHFIFDVTSTSTHKLKMGIWTASSANTIVNGGTSSTETGITFVRLGDT